MTRKTHLIRTGIFALALGASAGLAFAAGSGGSNDGGNNGSGGGTSTPFQNSPDKLHCKSGQIVKHKTVNGTKKYYCANAQQGALPDDELFEQASALAKAGYYDWALDLFNLMQDKNNPDALNMMGYSHRKAGRMDVAVSYYRKALGINPNLVQAREYLGEGYVAAGRVDLARLELGEIKQRCGMSCDQYIDLKKVIETASN